MLKSLKLKLHSWTSINTPKSPITSFAIIYCIVLGVGFLSIGQLWSTGLKFGDVPVYQDYGNAILAGEVPYKDLVIEYPPGVLPILVIATILGNLIGNFLAAYIILTSLAISSFIYVSKNIVSRKVLLLVILSALPIANFIYMCLDVFPALFLFLAVLSTKKNKFCQAAILFAFAVSIKFYPIICIVPLLLAVPRQMRRRFLLVFLSVIVSLVLWALYLSPSGALRAVTYHIGRPIEIMSAPASVGYAEKLFGREVSVGVYDMKWMFLSFPGERTASLISTVLLVAGVLIISYAFYSRGLKLTASGCVLLLATYISLFKVGSPQFIVAILALLPLVSLEIKNNYFIKTVLMVAIINATIFFTFILYWKDFWFGGVGVGPMVILRSVLQILLALWLAKLVFANKNVLLEPRLEKSAPN